MNDRTVYADEKSPSEQQWAIYDQAADMQTGMSINAVAGSGKTSTLQGIARRSELQKDCLALAFSKHNAQAFEMKMPMVESSTIHSLALRTLKQTWRYLRMSKDSVDAKGYKMKDIVKELKLDKKYPRYDDWEVRAMLSDVVHFAMVSLTPPTGAAIEEMADRFTVRLPGSPDEVASDVEQIICRSRQLFFGGAEGGHSYMNFDEMIYWPTVEQIVPAPFHTVMVDEKQDLNNMQRAFVRLIPKERLIGCGDPNQAIMMFAGAENDSMLRFQEDFSLAEFPLSCSFRCGKKIIEHAQRVVPRITYANWQLDGSVEQIKDSQLLPSLRATHGAGMAQGENIFVLCRINAPLVGLCFTLIMSGVRAKIRGKDTGRALCTLVRQIQGKDSDMLNFSFNLDRWVNKERERIFSTGGRRAEVLIGGINDKAECLSSFYDNLQPQTADAMCAGINAMFTDDTLPGVNLMSVHASKGLEAETVYIVHPEKLPLEWNGQSEAQFQQELNLDYVARTRAMKRLIYVERS